MSQQTSDSTVMLQVEHPSHVPKKSTMIKPRVGMVKTSTYSLPQSGHVYGKKSPENPEGVAEIISSWVTADPSLEEKSKKIVVYSNVLAVKHGCITARAMRQYGKDHPNIRLKEVLNTEGGNYGSAKHEGPFGKTTQFAEEPMGDILQAKYTRFDDDYRDYPDVRSIKKIGVMPEPKTTVAAQSIILTRMKAEEEKSPKKPFIMKKFQNIPSKLNLPDNISHKTKVEKDT